MMLQACVNGARPVAAHPELSNDADRVAHAAALAIDAGADAVHVHPKGADGRDSLGARDVQRWVSAIRRRRPGTPVGVTTGAWSASGERRLEQVGEWRVVPDFASVNWHEDGAHDLAELLISLGVAVEAGLWTREAARTWSGSALAPQCVRALVELPDVPADAVADAAGEMLVALGRVPAGVDVLLHGEERSAWAAARLAGERGLSTRIGLEDTLLLPDGTVAASNAQLMAAIRCAPARGNLHV